MVSVIRFIHTYQRLNLVLRNNKKANDNCLRGHERVSCDRLILQANNASQHQLVLNRMKESLSAM